MALLFFSKIARCAFFKAEQAKIQLPSSSAFSITACKANSQSVLSSSLSALPAAILSRFDEL